MKSGVIIAHDKGKVFLESAKKKPLSLREATDKYQIGDGKGRHYVETDVDESRLEWIKNKRYHEMELTVKGDLLIKNVRFFWRK